MLTQDEVARLAAREAREGDRVELDPDLVAVRAHLHGTVTLGDPLSRNVPADLVILSASRVLTQEPANGYGATHTAASTQGTCRRVLVLLPAADIALTDVLDYATETARGSRAVERIITSAGIVDITPEGLVLRQLAPKVSAREFQTQTQQALLAGPDLGEIEL